MHPDDPRHGTRRQPLWETAPGCGCESCELSRAHRRRLYKQAQLGRPARVPVDLVVRHVRSLMSSGWTQNDIAKAAGVGQATISEALGGVCKLMSVDCAAAVMGVSGPARPSFVPAHGTRRRIQALVAMGWMAREVSEAAGLSPQFLPDLLSKNQATVSAATADAVSLVYERLSMSIPEMTASRRRSRTMAAKKGWAPPLAFDNIDDPNERPSLARDRAGRPRDDYDPARVERILGGDWSLAPGTRKPERIEIIQRWAGSLYELEQITGWKIERDYRKDGAA